MIGELLTDMLYPRRCAVCDRIVPFGGELICREHTGKLPYVTEPACLRCGKEVESESLEYCMDCERHSRSFDRGFPVFNYEEPVKSSVLAIKYHGKQEYCDFYGRELGKKLAPYVFRYDIDGIAYVPVHRRKLKERGYNQAYLLAKSASKELKLPVLTDMLVRKEYTSPQKLLDNLERANNIKMSMDIGKLYEGHKNILLIDDIYTTGVTVNVCSDILRKAGAEHVYVATVCIGKGR